MQTKTSNKTAQLCARDFVYVNDEVIGRSYQNGPYAILVGSRSYYAVTYKGKTIDFNLRTFESAIEACACHEWVRRSQEGKGRYTQRCEQAEKGLLPRVSRK